MAERPLDIVGFGALSIDEMIFVDRPFQAGKGAVLRRETTHGGNVATALAAASSLSARAGFVGWLGTLDVDRGAVSDLEAWGVSTAGALRSPSAHPILSTIIVDSTGERFIAFDDKTLVEAPDALIDDDLSGARVLVVDSYAIRSLGAVRAARAAGIAVVADIEWLAGSPSQELADLADHLVLPFAQGATLTGLSDPAAILEALWRFDRSAVVLTHGADGAYWRDGSQPASWHQPGYSVEVVDTTGCGDCFHGAYAAGLAFGLRTEDRVRLACAAAALAATGRGGRGHLATRAEAEAMMSKQVRPVRQLPASKTSAIS